MKIESLIAIQVSNFTKKYGELAAVDHISFEVRNGEILGFLGSNGAGKTTTIGMLTGRLQISEIRPENERLFLPYR